MYSVTVPFFAKTDREKMLRQLERCGVRRVALVSNHAQGVVISSEADFMELQEAVAFFREKGYEVIIWIGETVGHSRSRVTERKKYMPLRFFEKDNFLCDVQLEIFENNNLYFLFQNGHIYATP